MKLKKQNQRETAFSTIFIHWPNRVNKNGYLTFMYVSQTFDRHNITVTECKPTLVNNSPLEYVDYQVQLRQLSKHLKKNQLQINGFVREIAYLKEEPNTQWLTEENLTEREKEVSKIWFEMNSYDNFFQIIRRDFIWFAHNFIAITQLRPHFFYKVF